MPNWRNEPRWPAPDELIQINADFVAETGEPFGILKAGDLEAACSHPINQWHYGGQRDPVDLAVGLMLAVARAHPFRQGNKRTAFAAGQLLLVGQGLLLHLPDETAIADLLRLGMTGDIAEAGLAAHLRPYLRPLEQPPSG